MMFYVLRALLVSFCRSVPLELSGNFYYHHQDIKGVPILLKFRTCKDHRHHIMLNVDGNLVVRRNYTHELQIHMLFIAAHTHIVHRQCMLLLQLAGGTTRFLVAIAPSV